MEKNAWAVTEEIQRQLDNVLILGEYIKALLTEKSNNGFFFIWDYLARYMEASEAKRKDLPGHAYSKKIWDFYNAHYNNEITQLRKTTTRFSFEDILRMFQHPSSSYRTDDGC